MAKQKDGRYRAKITVGRDADGNPIVKYVSGRTKKELEAAKAELKKRYVGGIEVQREVTFGEYAKEWYDIYKKPNVSYSTQKTYDSTFRVHLLPELGERQMRAITANDLQSLMNEKQGLGLSTMNSIKTIIVNVFAKAYAQGIIDRDPSAGLTRPAAKKKDSRRALTDAETKAVLKVADKHPDGMILKVLYYTGMRLGEACGLQWQDIDFKARTISVRRDVDFKAGCIGDVKTKYSIRDIPMPSKLFEAIFPLRGLGGAFVLPAPSGEHWRNTPLSRVWLELMAAVYAEDNSIESRETEEGRASILTPHYFRHNYATVLYYAGVDVLTAQRYLGHAKAQTTIDIYTHLNEEKAHKDADKLRNYFQ